MKNMVRLLKAGPSIMIKVGTQHAKPPIRLVKTPNIPLGFPREQLLGCFLLYKIIPILAATKSERAIARLIFKGEIAREKPPREIVPIPSQRNIFLLLKICSFQFGRM